MTPISSSRVGKYQVISEDEAEPLPAPPKGKAIKAAAAAKEAQRAAKAASNAKNKAGKIHTSVDAQDAVVHLQPTLVTAPLPSVEQAIDRVRRSKAVLDKAKAVSHDASQAKKEAQEKHNAAVAEMLKADDASKSPTLPFDAAETDEEEGDEDEDEEDDDAE